MSTILERRREDQRGLTIYRGPNFLAVYDSAPHPPPPPFHPQYKLDRKIEKERQFAEVKGGEGDGHGSESSDRKNAWSSYLSREDILFGGVSKLSHKM